MAADVKITLDPEEVVTVTKWYRPDGSLELIIKTGESRVGYLGNARTVRKFIKALTDIDEAW